MVLQWLTRRKSKDEPADEVWQSPEKIVGKGYSKMDVGQIYNLINANNLPRDEYGKIKEAAIELGHLGLLDRVLDVGFDGRKPDRRELRKCLAYAVPFRGISIENINTSVGGCYQRLYGQDFWNAEIILNDGTPVSFEDAVKDPYWVAQRINPEEVRDYIASGILMAKGVMTQEERKGFMKSKYSPKEEN